MKAKQIHIGLEARDNVVRGVELTYEAVTSTLGPYGATVVIENDIRKDNPPTVTKDGVSVASVINLPDQLQQLGARLVLQASKQADTKSGDGTTTTVALAHGLIAIALQRHREGVLPITIRSEIGKSVEAVIEQLKQISEDYPVTDEIMECVALISANGEKRLSEVAISAHRSANGGPVAVKSHREEVDELEVLHGAILPGAPLTIDAIDRNASVTTVDTPSVGIYNGRLNQLAVAEFDRMMSAARTDSVLLIIVKTMEDGVEEQVARINQTNHDRKGNGNTIIVTSAPGAGSQRQRYLGILSQMIGAPVIEPGHEVVLGEAQRIQIENKRISLVPSNKFAQEETVERIQAERNSYGIGTINYRHTDELLRFVLGRRVTVYVGGMTEADIKERQDRMVDAVHAIDAVRDGVIPGGGTALAMIASKLDDHYTDAYTLPFRKILLNGGISEREAEMHLREAVAGGIRDEMKYAYYYDLINGEYLDLIEADQPVYDPVRVTINALRAAAQVAITVVTSNCYIIED